MDGIGGYRLVRRLGAGPRAEVHLARLDGDDEREAGVVVKVYRPEVDAAAISTEIEALARGVGEHTVALLDVATAPSGQHALVLARLPGGSLGRLLAHRLTLSLGEVAGILAPLAETLEALHRSGVAHGGVRPDSVLFDAEGVPVLAGFGQASLLEPGLPPAHLDQEPAVQDDRAAFAVLARTVLERCESFEVVRSLVDGVAAGLRAGEVAQRLRAIAEPVPADLRAASPVVLTSPIPSRVPLQAEPPSRLPAVHRDPHRLSELLAGVLDQQRLRALIESLRSVRLRVWLLAGTAAVAVVAALVLVPVGGAPPEVDAAPAPSPSSSTAGSEVIADEDPVDALVRLLIARDACLADRSVLCLDSVAQQGSAALAEDQELVRALQAGAETPPSFLVEADRIAIVERLGDAVLLTIDGTAGSQPGSVLIARGDRGWLLRDFLDG